MSIVVILEWDEVVPDESQYWAITDKLGTRERVPEGCEYHLVGVDPGKSVRVCEVWESEEAHDRFMEQVGPFFQEVGVPPPSKVTVVPSSVTSVPRRYSDLARARTYRGDVSHDTEPDVGMPSTPAAINAAFAAGYNSRDVEALAALYEQDAVVTNPDGSIAVGIDAIRVHLCHLIELGGVMTSENRYAIPNGDLALVGADWEIDFTGDRERIVGRSAEVVRQQPDGSWRYVLDHPGTG